MPELAPHPFAEKYPALPHNQFLSLCNDIVVKGLLEPIVLYQGKILDGWHRYQACVREKVEPKFVEFQPGADSDYWDVEAWEFVRSKNWVRRHLTAEQRQQVAEELLNFNPMQSDRAIARQAGVSHRTVAKLRNRPWADQSNGHGVHKDIASDDASGDSYGHHVHYDDAVPAPFEDASTDAVPLESGERESGGPASSDSDAAISPYTADDRKERESDHQKPQPAERFEESGRKARGRKPGSKNTKPKEIKPKPLTSARDESANILADQFRRDVTEAVESLVQIVSGYDGLIQQKLSLVRRQELVAKFAKALGVAVALDLGESF